MSDINVSQRAKLLILTSIFQMQLHQNIKRQIIVIYRSYSGSTLIFHNKYFNLIKGISDDDYRIISTEAYLENPYIPENNFKFQR